MAPILMILAGGVLGVMRGGAWWGILSVGTVSLVAVLFWGVIRKRPKWVLNSHGIMCGGRMWAWHEIESFGAGSAEYAPDWVSLTDTMGEVHVLDSTFGWTNTALRDALNGVLRERNPRSARNQFETARDVSRAVEVRGASDKAEGGGVFARFRRPSGPEDALAQTRRLLARYYHPDCHTFTEVSERVLRIAAYDPHYFPLQQTVCVGCGSAPMKEVILDNGQTLYEVFRAMQRAVPLRAQIGKFFLCSLVLAPLGVAVGWSIPVPRNGWLLSVLGGGVGFLLGILLSMVLYRPLRRSGWMW